MRWTRGEKNDLFQELGELTRIEGTSGDESAIQEAVAARVRPIPGAELRRIQDNLIAWRGRPQVAVFAHVDTIGFTLGYDRELIRIGGPQLAGGEALRCTVNGTALRGRVARRGDRWLLEGAADAFPGSRWVYDGELELDGLLVRGPYLDNRAGVWSALEVLRACEHVAVAFTANEEHSGRGAATCARWLFGELAITRALISDLTWHTRFIRRGHGPAVSLRDRNVPRQSFLDEVLAAAADSGFPFQREIESDGSSDGGSIERSGVPMDWVFVGAPQEASHTPQEILDLSDLRDQARLTAHLVRALSDDSR